MNDPLDELYLTPRGWMVRWHQARLWLYVAGDVAGPSPAHLATLRDLVARWPEVCASIEAYLRRLLPDGQVALRGRGSEGFAAASCGFDQPFLVDSVAVDDPAAPARARVLFCTGQPDGYVTFEAALEAGVPLSLDSFCS